MAYQQVSRPRFWVSILQWLNALGKLIPHPDFSNQFTYTFPLNRSYMSIVDIDPSAQASFQAGSAEPSTRFLVAFTSLVGNFNTLMPNNKNFFMLLGHNFKGDTLNEYAVDQILVKGVGGSADWLAHEEYLNYQIETGNLYRTTYNGFTIGVGDGEMESGDAIDHAQDGICLSFVDNAINVHIYKLGSFLYGTYYDMPQSPNLSLNMNTEYGGTKNITTYKGSSYSNTMWNQQPSWGDYGAWELWGEGLSDYPQKLARSGRRTWDLTFSYLDSSELWGSNQLVSQFSPNTSTENTDLGYDSGDVNYDSVFNYNILTDENFFSQVWHKTLNGTLPFVFQPDRDNKHTDNFAICRFKNNLKVTQTAFNVYNVSVSIEEVW